ncbi:hypothetical protein [Candidatus Villigracilis affinis]|uniref:hypothetical protein n=1 Tax=Candidatus Villigracilis affinis TaxID=3140682 RepID=UPI001DEA5725|nr:hypothetical protein [Anaerolineales bacterium]
MSTINFEPQGMIAIGIMGLIGVWLSMRTGFPNAWDARVSNKQRLIIPIITGLLLGSLFLATDLITGMSRLQQEQLNIKSTDVAFPASIFVYSAGAIFVEVVYRLLTIPLLLGMISIFVRSQSAREKVFWMLAILTSIIEPLNKYCCVTGACAPRFDLCACSIFFSELSSSCFLS